MTDVEESEDDYGGWNLSLTILFMLGIAIGFGGIFWVAMHENYEVGVTYESSSELTVFVGMYVPVEKINYIEVNADNTKKIIDSPRKWEGYTIKIPKNSHVTVDIYYINCHKDRIFDNGDQIIQGSCIGVRKPLIEIRKLMDLHKEYTFGSVLRDI